MFEVNGSFASAKVFSTVRDEKAIEQIRTLCSQPFVSGVQVRIMPDYHYGAGCTIGFTANLGDKVVPNLVGVDIGCGILAICLGKIELDLREFDHKVCRRIPAGFASHKKPVERFPLQKLWCLDQINGKDFEAQIGTLGGGNHFIEVGKDELDVMYLMIHSGSRNLGKRVADHYQRIAVRTCREKGVDVADSLAYLEGEWKRKYIDDMQLCQKYASLNRNVIARLLLDGEPPVGIETIHNYLNMRDGIIRKGAVSAYRGERLILPLNMRDGALICVGKGNPDWNYSAPHGAGRLYGRNEARRLLTMRSFEDAMEGICSTSISRDTLDEAPQAYKPMAQIIGDVADSVTIEKHIRPIYNFKAGRE